MTNWFDWIGPVGFGIISAVLHYLLGVAGALIVLGAVMIFYGEGLHRLKK